MEGSCHYIEKAVTDSW